MGFNLLVVHVHFRPSFVVSPSAGLASQCPRALNVVCISSVGNSEFVSAPSRQKFQEKKSLKFLLALPLVFFAVRRGGLQFQESFAVFFRVELQHLLTAHALQHLLLSFYSPSPGGKHCRAPMRRKSLKASRFAHVP